MSPTWTRDLLLGVEPVDGQHRELFARVDAFFAALEAGPTPDLLDLLTFLGAHVETHFAAEEELMRHAGYPDLAPHRREHATFLERFRELVQDFAAHGPSAELAGEVRREVGDWLDLHIRTTDQALGRFLRSR